MVGLPEGEKNVEDICNRLHTIPACDRQTDRQTDILPRHSPRYAYGSRSKNLTETEQKYKKIYSALPYCKGICQKKQCLPEKQAPERL